MARASFFMLPFLGDAVFMRGQVGDPMNFVEINQHTLAPALAERSAKVFTTFSSVLRSGVWNF